MARILHRVGTWAVVVLGWLIPLSAAAATGASSSTPAARASTEDAVEQARQAYTDAVRAYEEQRYKDAIDSFEEANELAPDPAFSFNIGIAYEDMGDAAGALRHYRAYLRRAPTASDRAEVEARIENLEARLAEKGVQQVTVYSEPAGATLFVDDKPLGVTPWTGELAPGVYELTLTKRGYRDVRRQLTLPVRRALDVEVRLQRSRASRPRTTLGPQPRELAEERTPGLLTHVEPVTWTVLGAAAASFGAAVGFELSRANHERAARRQVLQIDAARRLEQARDREMWAKGFTLLGAGLSVTGVVLGYLDIERGVSRPDWVDASCAREGCILRYQSTF